MPPSSLLAFSSAFTSSICRKRCRPLLTPGFSALLQLCTSSNSLPTRFPTWIPFGTCVHTFIRPPAAALLAYASTGAVAPEWRWGAALLAGGVALTSHSAKASTRAAINTSPEPFSNWTLSFGEDLLAVWLTWMATAHPLAARYRRGSAADPGRSIDLLFVSVCSPGISQIVRRVSPELLQVSRQPL